MLRFREMKTLQKSASVQATLHNLFNQERHLIGREHDKQRRSEAFSEWQALAG
jgi:putative transposase